MGLVDVVGADMQLAEAMIADQLEHGADSHSEGLNSPTSSTEPGSAGLASLGNSLDMGSRLLGAAVSSASSSSAGQDSSGGGAGGGRGQ
jgi:hypothetical protein